MAAETGQTTSAPNAEETTDPGYERDPMGVVFWMALTWLGVVVFLAAFAWALPLADPNRINPADGLRPIFSDGNLLGTDGLGRDTLARLAHGARISVVISLTSVLTGTIVGGVIGTTVAYVGGFTEKATMWLVNVILSFPGLILLLAVVAMVGASLTSLTLTISFLAIPGYIRFSRASTLAFTSLDYVAADRMLGATRRSIIFRSLLPNVLATLATFGLLALDVRHRLRREVVVSVGCLTASLVHPREVFQEAVVSRAAALVLFHNHPSGDPEPSAEDLALTRRLVQAGTLMGIEVLDHVVLGRGRYVSLKERGVL